MPRLKIALLATLAALALSGCLRFSADLSLSEDDTVSGSFVVAVKEGTGESYGMSDREMAEDIWSDYRAAKTLDKPKVSDYKSGGFVGIEVSFADAPLADFAPAADAWGISRVGDEFVVSGPSNASATTPDTSSSDAPGGTFTGDTSQLEDAELSVAITFPGPISSSNGEVAGRTVAWDLQAGPATLDARGSAIKASDPAVSMAYVMWVVIAVGAIAYALAGKVARRRR
jgi:hypothetical protein